MWKTLLVLLTMSQSAFAYKFTRDFQNGFYWKNLPIDISVVDKDPVRKSKLEDLTESAILEWEQGTGLTIWNFLPGSNTTNVIRWSTNFKAETSMDPVTVLAVAVRYTEGPYFSKTEIIINGNHPEIVNNNTNLYTTIKHELGHTMGLDHSDVSSAIMWPELQHYGGGIGQDDVQGMTAAYDTIIERQLTRYVSPLAYEKSSEAQGLSCATVAATPMVSAQGLLSLLLGILISFVRKVKAKLTSRK